MGLTALEVDDMGGQMARQTEPIEYGQFDHARQTGANESVPTHFLLSIHFHQNPIGISIKIEIEVSWCEWVSHAVVAVAAARSILLQMRGPE